jgi:drug/metabolite transporter (DMT)-like permease
VLAGLAVGFLGVALLARGHSQDHSSGNLWGIAVLMAASLAWAFGSIYSRGAPKVQPTLLGVAMQMIGGGVLLMIIAFFAGEPNRFQLSQVTGASIGAWLYLVGAGSLIGYTAYVWLLHVSTPARVATYGYVNPLIAVLLGCTIGHELFSRDLILAGAMIIVSVVMIVSGSMRKPAAASNRVETQPPICPASEAP